MVKGNAISCLMAADTSQGDLSQYVNNLKYAEGGREKMGEFERYYREEGRKTGEASGQLKERLKNIKALMKNMKVSAQEAMRMLSVPPEEQEKLMSML